MTTDDAPTSTWLIYDTDEADLAWCRVPDGAEPQDLVDAHQSAGGHSEPAEVLLWLQGEQPLPWTGHDFGGGDAVAVQELGYKIRHS